jgi:hypothetical protein
MLPRMLPSAAALFLEPSVEDIHKLLCDDANLCVDKLCCRSVSSDPSCTIAFCSADLQLPEASLQRDPVAKAAKRVIVVGIPDAIYYTS